MMDFFESIAGQQGGDPLGSPAEMMAKMGISPRVPHDVVLKRMVKRWGKHALTQPILKARARVAPTPLRGQNRPGPTAT